MGIGKRAVGGKESSRCSEPWPDTSSSPLGTNGLVGEKANKQVIQIDIQLLEDLGENLTQFIYCNCPGCCVDNG